MTVATREKVNSFELSLGLGFTLNEQEASDVAVIMRSVDITSRQEVIIPAKMMTPSTKGLSSEEKQRIFDEVDEVNAVRTARVRKFLGTFLPSSSADLLASRIRPNVQGLVVLRCPTDRHFTLIVEHS